MMDWIEVKARTVVDAFAQAEDTVCRAARIGREKGLPVAKRARIVLRSVKSEFLLEGPLPGAHTFVFEVEAVER